MGEGAAHRRSEQSKEMISHEGTNKEHCSRGDAEKER
jgi:hypothetical protein